MLTSLHLFALSPLILVCAAAVTVMLGIAWTRQHAVTALVSAAGLLVAMVLLGLVAGLGDVQTPLLVFDGVTVLATLMILVSSLVCVALAHGYLSGYPGPREEFYLLLLCGAAGAMVLVASRHMVTLFLGLELMSLPLYGLLAYCFRTQGSLEAGIKYLVLSAAATAFLLFGMALLYSQTGRLDFPGLAMSAGEGASGWMLTGAGLMIVGLGFKLSLVPFHMWTPDVYQGGPAATVAFLATVSKLAVFIVLLRLVLAIPGFQAHAMQGVIAALSLASMLAGNILALLQSDLKRLLGYSSIAHFGYLLVALVAGTGGLVVEAAGVYLVTYLLATLAAFGVVTLVSMPLEDEDGSALHVYRGLFWRRPYLAAVLTIAMLSLAGIPFTAGFVGKFYVFALGVEAGHWWLVAGIVVGSAIGLYYYLRVLITLYLMEPGMARQDAPANWSARASGLLVVALAVIVLLLGLYPAPLIDWAAGISLYAG